MKKSCGFIINQLKVTFEIKIMIKLMKFPVDLSHPRKILENSVVYLNFRRSARSSSTDRRRMRGIPEDLDPERLTASPGRCGGEKGVEFGRRRNGSERASGACEMRLTR
ncbi:hypothetical protein P8452_60872 [Trifolium repens]|nr:hypothetical protein QL285_038242 [Trifolium repens]WJX77579.1 hypothetical protein P8452_60872 [Trifolium repens]